MKTAICCIAKNEDQYIDEFVQYHWKLGIDDVFVFQNNWRYQGTLPEKFNNLGKHHMYLYPLDGDLKQLDAYNLFMHSFSQMHDWCAFIDVDEFICVRSESKTLQDILGSASQHPSLVMNWRLFGSSGLKFDGRRDVVTRFTKCGRDLNRHIKQFVNLKMIRDNGILDRAFFVNPHFGNWSGVNLEGNSVIGPYNYQNLSLAHDIELNHYVTKTYDECKEKVARGRADALVMRNLDEFFKEHDMNEVEDTAAKDFYEN